MKTWNVYVHRPKPVALGQVHEDNETLARCAALSKFSISEDEYFDAERVGKEAMGISPGDDFSVSPA